MDKPEQTASGSEAVEEVLVVPRRDLEATNLLTRGFRKGPHDELARIIETAGFFLSRPLAEKDPACKQIIPYAVLRSQGRVFLLRRTSRGGEPRLHDLYSVGVGGHINPASVPLARCVDDGLRRELEEELFWEVPYDVRPLGTLNDDSNAVGQVHLGVVFLVETPSPDVYVRETDLLEGRFALIDELRQRVDEMETWSQMIVRTLYGDSTDGG